MSVAGNWNLSIATPMGTQSAVVTFVEDGSGVTGTASADGESLVLDGLTVDGDRVVWTQDVTRPMKLSVTFDLTVTGDAIGGTAKAAMFPPSTVTGTRA